VAAKAETATDDDHGGKGDAGTGNTVQRMKKAQDY
jgi:hypothetical protein